MRRSGGSLATGVLLVGLMSACGGSDQDGTGFLVMADLEKPPVVGHFTAQPADVTARLAARPDGCVTVMVDGAERLPFWPTGTVVAQESGNHGAYVVTLPTGSTLRAEGSDGDEFAAEMIVDEGTDAFATADDEPSEKVAGFVAFCDLDTAAVAIPDAETVIPLPR
jgi:hypothetical protein